MLKKSQLQKCFRIGEYFWCVNQLKLNAMKKLILISAILLSAVVMNAQVQSPTAKNNNAPVSIKISELPKAIIDNIAKSYTGYAIKEAYSLKKWKLIPDPWQRNIQLSHHQNQELKQALAERNNFISGQKNPSCDFP